MARAHILGFPRIGAKRELKSVVEDFWQGKVTESALKERASELKRRHWAFQEDAGMDLIAVGDFSLYDQLLDWQVHLGALPERFELSSGTLSLQDYFALARGRLGQRALEMTKWFDTNYHYLVPEVSKATAWNGSGQGLLAEVEEAVAAGYSANRIKPVLVGPVTFLYLSKSLEGTDRLEHLPAAIKAYSRILTGLKARGVEWVQIDEPVAVLDLSSAWSDALKKACTSLGNEASRPQILLATYFEGAGHHAELLDSLPIEGLHLDFVRDPEQLNQVVKNGKTWLETWPQGRVLSAGVVNGRNIWKADLDRSLQKLRSFSAIDEVWVSASCSLLHVPVDLEFEDALDPEVRDGLAFAVQKLQEIAALKKADDGSSTKFLETQRQARTRFLESAKRLNPAVREKIGVLKQGDQRRPQTFEERQQAQQTRLKLPPWPTTTIGSFPQTKELRSLRSAYKKNLLSNSDYETALKEEIRAVIRFQEEAGLDVLVHGEPERNDMVEYFGEKLEGFAFTKKGWVQSYGTRCVKPPIIHGDVSRPLPMTVSWTLFAQEQTLLPVKGMLTGPVTILKWAFPREDLPAEESAFQLALALKEEVLDLEKAGIAVIQIDEPAFREGLPLRKSDRAAYWAWAVKAFRAVVTNVKPETQIHSHMCYCDFSDCLEEIAALDADVLSLEASRSGMDLLGAFERYRYPNAVGPGVWDIHSPIVPEVQEMVDLLKKAATVLPAERLWVNPDCGLKTRDWKEVKSALLHLTEAAKTVRKTLHE